jgi:hypothetical protein
VDEKPVFTLTQKNRAGTFPLPPGPGAEYRFCTDEKADAFLTGSLSEYYGRVFLDLRMYTRYSGSYSYENSVLFSYEDFDNAVDEIANHLALAISVVYPSTILVRSSPPEAMVLIDGAYAGRGELESRTHSPGKAEIEVIADNHIPVSIPLELKAGELAELFINLTPLGLTAFSAEVTGKPGSKVFLGSLYMGETPLTLDLPVAESSYISVETPEGEGGAVILRDNNIVHGAAQFERNDSYLRADFLTTVPVSEEEKLVGNTRNNFYKAYGVFWFILPASMLAAGIAGTYIASNDYVTSNNLYSYDQEKRARISDNASFGSTIQTFSYGLIGASLGVAFYQIYKYLHSSRADATPIVKEKEKEKCIPFGIK